MRTIASVAIVAIEKKKASLCSDGWAERYRDTYKAWVEMRRQRGSDYYNNIAEWRDFVSRKLDDMLYFYKDGSKKDQRDRTYWTESGNIRLSITVMGGYKKYPKWSVDICVAIVDHLIN